MYNKWMCVSVKVSICAHTREEESIAYLCCCILIFFFSMDKREWLRMLYVNSLMKAMPSVIGPYLIGDKCNKVAKSNHFKYNSWSIQKNEYECFHTLP